MCPHTIAVELFFFQLVSIVSVMLSSHIWRLYVTALCCMLERLKPQPHLPPRLSCIDCFQILSLQRDGGSCLFNHTEIIPRWHYCLHSTCYAVFSSTTSIFHCHFKLSTFCPEHSLSLPLLLRPWYKYPQLLSENYYHARLFAEKKRGRKANDVGLSSYLIKIL